MPERRSHHQQRRLWHAHRAAYPGGDVYKRQPLAAPAKLVFKALGLSAQSDVTEEDVLSFVDDVEEHDLIEMCIRDSNIVYRIHGKGLERLYALGLRAVSYTHLTSTGKAGGCPSQSLSLIHI